VMRVPVARPVAETIQPESFERSAPIESRFPANRFQLASLESVPITLPEAPDSDAQSDFTTSIRRRAYEAPVVGGRAGSFGERFAGVADWPYSRPAATDERATDVLAPAPDLRSPRQPARAVAALAPSLPPVSVVKKPVRVAEAVDDSTPSSPPPEEDEHTAIYDIVARKVYLPGGRILEAHSGLGSHIDDPRYVSERDRGPTPPNVYDLSMREELFHGVRALRLTPVGNGNMYGRDGILAHSYMLGPNGQSNGCVSFNDYQAFLNAYQSGEVTRLVVVDHLATPPSVKTAAGWIPRALSVLFGRS
jgi:type VI secretion system (T6SS) effector TldE1-like protein